MFPADSFACAVVSGFFPVFADAYNCSSGFVTSMIVGCIASFILRNSKRSRAASLFSGILAYYGYLAIFPLIANAMTPSSNQEQLGWFLFASILFLPRALLASAIGVICWEAYYFIKTTVRGNRLHGKDESIH